VKTTVNIPVGTVMRDASNNALSGTVTVQVVSFNATENSSLFPGGLDNSNVKVGNEVQSGLFTPAAFASVSMSVNGTPVKNFTGPTKVSVRLSLDKTTVNPDTDALYKNLDPIDVYSYNTTTGQWEFEVASTVQKDNSDNSLFVLYETTHLSYFAVGNFNGKVSCSSGPHVFSTVTHTVNWNGTADAVNVLVQIRRASTKDVVSSFTRNFIKGDKFELEAFGTTSSLYLTFTDINTRIEYLRTANRFNRCSAQNFNLGTINKGNEVKLNFTATCPSLVAGAAIQPPLGTQVLFKRAGTNDRYNVLHIVDSAITARSGSIVTNLLVVGNSYDFKVVAGTVERFRTNIRINSANESYSLALGDGLCDLLKQ
jgi:hypothetical protein